MFKTWKIDEILCRIMHKTDVYKNWVDYCKRDKSMEENKKRNIWPEIEMLAPGVWNIEFGFGNTVYVVEGSKKAIVIDTGMSDAQILPVIKTLTDKPLELAITHVHGDHMRYASDFSVRYMSDWDVAIADQMLDRFDMPALDKPFIESMQAAEIAWKNKTPINEPNVKMAQNLYNLCGDILQKKTVGIPRADMSGGGGTVPLMAMKDNATILYTEELI